MDAERSADVRTILTGLIALFLIAVVIIASGLLVVKRGGWELEQSDGEDPH